ncbi:hypothetical protein STAQ_29620 [Allostella sp. ATCC 35155]|nr:hypothetical protein STAQ_29620 [Stella sp. ATCC 35155]
MSEQIRRRPDGTIDIASYHREIGTMRVDYFAEVARILKTAPAWRWPMLRGARPSATTPLKKI